MHQQPRHIPVHVDPTVPVKKPDSDSLFTCRQPNKTLTHINNPYHFRSQKIHENYSVYMFGCRNRSLYCDLKKSI